jgi:hypothetical protein
LNLGAKSEIENMCVAFWCLTPTPTPFLAALVAQPLAIEYRSS